MIKLLKEQFFLHKSFCVYFLISVFVTVLDVSTSRLCELFTEVVIANTIGVVVGFIVQYFLTSRHVYNSKDIIIFIKFLTTFLFGLLLANAIVYICRTWIFQDSETLFAFLASKGLSIVIPFFLLYFVRKHWIKTPVKES